MHALESPALVRYKGFMKPAPDGKSRGLGSRMSSPQFPSYYKHKSHNQNM